MPRRLGTGSVAAAVAVGLASAVSLWWASRIGLPGPPLPGAGQDPNWRSREGLAPVLFGTARLGLLGASVATGGAATLVLVGRVMSAGVRLAGRRLLWWAAWLAPRARHLGLGGVARVAVGVSGAGGVLAAFGCAPASRSTEPAATAAPAAPVRSPPAPVLIAGGPAPATAPTTQEAPPTARAPTTRAPTTTQAPTTTRAPSPAAPHPAAPPPASTVPSPPEVHPPAATRPRTWTVRPGDDFWSIAESVVAESEVAESGRSSPEAGPVARYWSRLISANRDRLPDPGNPSLLFPGDVLAVPPLEPGSG